MDRQPDCAEPTPSEVLLRRVRSRVRQFPVPDDTLVPLEADDRELRRFGLPARPDARIRPREFDVWRRLLSPPFGRKLTYATQAFRVFFAQNYRIDPRGRRLTGGSRHERSENWSGGYIKPHAGRSFTAVWGSWTIPKPVYPAPGGAQPGALYKCSTWVGLDGQRRYFDSSLPQIGTSQGIDPITGAPVYEAWWQWWARGEMSPVVPILFLQHGLHAMDEMIARVEVTSPTSALLTLKNQTTGEFGMRAEVHAPMIKLPKLPLPMQPRISGATAEWVTERPTIWASDTLYEMPDYGSVTFRDCLGITAIGEHPPIGAKLINGYAVRQAPARIRIVSTAQFKHQHSEIETRFR
ncbi:G1 family glutamic endopeptidase [Dankookia sp. GCM10030260]|uniref:G1 family glutamic endopeptidase n=1 Tax=Dankookia sp. GCM10030260 TaxID=3273390 RepID=UPI00360E8356